MERIINRKDKWLEIIGSHLPLFKIITKASKKLKSVNIVNFEMIIISFSIVSIKNLLADEEDDI